MAPFIRYNVYLSPEQLAAVHRVYDREGTRVSEQIRRALDAWLIEKGQLAEKTRVPFKTVVPKERRQRRTAQ
jgi:hypothetical protein